MAILNKATGIKSFIHQSLKLGNVNPAINAPFLGFLTENRKAVAIVDNKAAYKYEFLAKKSDSLDEKLASLKIKNKNVAVLLPNNISFVIGMLGIWKSRNTVVPLHIGLPEVQLEYFIEDSESKVVVTTSEIYEKLHKTFRKMNNKVILIDDEIKPLIDEECIKAKRRWAKLTEKLARERAFIVYTSGTTGKPKGVVLSHLNVAAQVNSIGDAWQITNSDTCLHCLPLHHVHGLINGLVCPLTRGATIMMEPKFDAYEIWQKLSTIPSKDKHNPTVFMAVPTIYSQLIDTYHKTYDDKPFCREFIKSALSTYVRLMVSGSAPLRPQILKEWHEITGHTLLERYGMTEVGMALTNSLDKERLPGYVGKPFPGVQVRIVKFDHRRDSYKIICEGDELKTDVFPEQCADKSGELLVKSDNVSKEYWKRPEETALGTTKDGWFCTGDTATYEDGSYKILGRANVDIIKSGGFKVSALDVENVLIDHPNVQEVAIVPLFDRTWGEKVCAIIVWRGEDSFDKKSFIGWSKQHLPYYQVPKVVKLIEGHLPRNLMGKINKKELLSSVVSAADHN